MLDHLIESREPIWSSETRVKHCFIVDSKKLRYEIVPSLNTKDRDQIEDKKTSFNEGQLFVIIVTSNLHGFGSDMSRRIDVRTEDNPRLGFQLPWKKIQMTWYEIIQFLKTLNSLIVKLLNSSTQFSPNFKKLKSSLADLPDDDVKIDQNSPKMPKLSRILNTKSYTSIVCSMDKTQIKCLIIHLLLYEILYSFYVLTRVDQHFIQLQRALSICIFGIHGFDFSKI